MKPLYFLPRLLGALALLLLTAAGGRAQTSPPAASVAVQVRVPASMRAAPFNVARYLTVPPDFAIAVYARVSGARFMAVAPGGDLLVSQPSTGKVLLVRPGSGGADPVIAEFATGLRNPHDIVFHAIGATTYVYITESNQINRYTYAAGDLTARNREIVVAGLPDASTPELRGNYGHQLKNIALDGNHKLYVSIASTCNACLEDTQSDPVRGAIYQYNADGTGRRLFAQGLRNAEGLAFVPGTNRLWVVVNNRDNIAYPFDKDFDGDGQSDRGKVLTAYVDNHPPDEFTYVQDGGNYGWPFCNPNPDTTLDNMPFDRDDQFNRNGQVDCNGMTRISRGIQAHSAPLGLTFTGGTGFAAPYRGGAAAAYHGSWNRAKKTGYKVAYFPWNAATQAPTGQIDLVSGFLDTNTQNVLGRPVDVAVDAQGSLLISDDYSGTIYKLTYAPPTASLRAPENPAGTVAGLDYAYYQGAWNTLPDFAALTPAKTGTAAGFDLSPRTQDDNFAFRYTGYVTVPTDGQYTFATTSDDGSQLFIGKQLVVDNDGLHGAQERTGSISLKAGTHALTVAFFERGGAQRLAVSYQGPGLSKQLVPATALRRAPAPAPAGGLVAGDVYRLSPLSAPAKCLDVSGVSQEDGASVHQWTYAGQANQQWRLVSTNDGYYQLVSLNSPAGRPEVLDVANCLAGNNAAANGTDVQQYRWLDNSCQRWKFTLLSDGSYKINPKSALDAGQDQVLGVANCSPDNNDNGQANVRQWQWLDLPCQHWQLTLLSASARPAAVLASRPAAGPGAALSVYPNPAHDHLTVQLATPSPVAGTLTLRDGLGRVVHTQPLAAGAAQAQLDVRQLAAGLYLLHLQQGPTSTAQKVLIQP